MAEQKRGKRWPAIALGLGGGALLLVGAIFVFAGQRGQDPTVRAPRAEPSPAVEHPPWRIRVFTAGSRGTPSASQRRATSEQAPALQAAIEQIFDTFLLARDAESLSGDVIAPDAARALADSRLGLPPDLEDVEVSRRSAEIGVEARRARRAAARVVYVVDGLRSGQQVRVRHEADLWFEWSNEAWRAIAFEARRRPGLERSGS